MKKNFNDLYITKDMCSLLSEIDNFKFDDNKEHISFVIYKSLKFFFINTSLIKKMEN